jgi:hypothetical protein
MAALQALPFAVFVARVNGRVFPASPFFLKRRKMDQLQSIRARHPDRVALRVFVEQADRFCRCEIIFHRNLRARPMLPARTATRL